MFAWIGEKLLGALGGQVVTALLGFAQGWLDKQDAKTQGSVEQATKETVVSLATQRAIAQAVAAAPRGQDAVLKRLKEGSA